VGKNIINMTKIIENTTNKEKKKPDIDLMQIPYNLNVNDMEPYRKYIFDSINFCVKQDISRGVSYFYLIIKIKDIDAITNEVINDNY
jgi:hypothetical protein